MAGMMREDGFVSGWKDRCGHLHSTKEQMIKANDDFNLHQAMYAFTGEIYRIPLYARYDEVAEYIIRHFDTIELIMKKHGR